MTVNYTTNLALGQPVTGTESGTWGDDVNNSVTSYLDIAIAGGLAITVTTTDVTLTLTQGTSSATNIGSTTAQYAILNVSGAMTAARNLILPSSSRAYVINNNTTGGFALTVKGSATSGVTMVNGESAHIYWNGSDYAKAANTAGVATFTNLTYTGTLTGSTGVIAIGTNQIYKDSSGNVGIGTSSPGYRLDISAADTTASVGYAMRLRSNATATAATIQFTNSIATAQNGVITVTDAGLMSFSGAVYINSSSNVGIGTSSPALKLDVTGAASTNGSSRSLMGITDTTAFATGVGGGITFRAKYNTAGSYIDAGNIKGIKENATDGNSASALVFSTQANGGSPAEQMRIDSSGNVGIGTSSLSYKFEVQGSANTYFGQRIYNTNAGSSAVTYLQLGNDTNGATAQLGLNSSANTTNFGGANGLYLSNGLSAPIAFATAGSERMRIDSSGNVGIGTSSPGTKLDVNGAIRATGTSAILAFSKRSTGTGDAWGMYSQSGEYNIYDYTAAASRLVIDSSGNVGIGTNSPITLLTVSAKTNDVEALRINALGGGGGTQGKVDLGFGYYDGAVAPSVAIGLEEFNIASAGGNLLFKTRPDGSADSTLPTERARIDSSGNLLVGKTTTAIGTVGFRVEGSSGRFVTSLVTGAFNQINHTSGTGTEYAIEFLRSSSTVGSITTTTAATLYNTTSDQRLKENIVDAPEFGSVIDSLQVRSFDWKTDNTHQRAGFIAQELVTVAPEAVHQPADPEQMMAVDYSKLVPMLVKEIQSLRKRLADAGIA